MTHFQRPFARTEEGIPALTFRSYSADENLMTHPRPTANLRPNRGSILAHGRQQNLELLHRQGRAKQEPLERMAAQTSQELSLFFRLHTLANHRPAHRSTTGN